MSEGILWLNARLWTSRINGTTSLNINYTSAACLLVGRVLNCEKAYDDLLK